MGPSRQRFVALVVVAALLFAGGSPLAAQTSGGSVSPPPESIQSPQPPVASPDVTPNLDRIRQALSKPATIKIEDGRLRFYVEVVARWPTFQEFIGEYDLRNGPTRGGAMTHQEFLNLVTPRDLYGSAGIKPVELLQFSLVNWLGQELAKKAFERFREAREERTLREIRERIDRELAALAGRDR